MSGGPIGFRLFTCNNLEDLAKAYSVSRMAAPERYRSSGGVFAQEHIAVATRGMSIWLEQYLVKHGHVVAGMEFPFLRNAIDQVLNRYESLLEGGEASLAQAFGEEVLVWRIYRLLSDEDFMARSGMEGLRSYMARHTVAHTDELRRYELSVKLANLFYLYMAFIPEVLHPELCAGRNYQAYLASKGWQLFIWRQLCTDCGERSPASLMLKFLGEDRENLAKIGYEPITFFGISAMPPYFLKVLKKLSTVTTVNFFYLNYCDDFWGDVKSDWELCRDRRQGIDEDLDRHFNNTILGNFGIQGREFFNALLDLTEEGVEQCWEQTSETEPGEDDTLLARLQQEIRGNVEGVNGPLNLSDDDDSLTFHSCFHKTREVEVLHDCLLKLIERGHQPGHERLEMNDIIVMAPDISSYAAAIHCVFDQGPLRNKYSISDRSVQKANLLAATFLDILGLVRGNFEYSRVTALLGTDGLRNRFGITEEDAETLKTWLSKAKVRHGGIPRMPENFTWRHGLDRFLMKIALDAPEDQPGNPLGLDSVLPANIGTDGESLSLLGKLCTFWDALTRLVEEIRTGHRNGPEWCRYLLEQVPVFFQADSDCGDDYAALVRTLRELEKSMRLSGLEQDGDLPFEVMASALSGVMSRPAPGEPFLNGKITFCSLLPMRGIPRRVIAILGMDSGEFPRQETKVGFSLLTHSRGREEEGDYNLLKYYDRSGVVEDNFTFLEAIMSAQEHLLLFFKGKDPMTIKPAPRAVPVDVLYESACRLVEGGAKTASKLLVEHSLNSYDATAFRSAREGKKVVPQQDMTLRGSFSYSVGSHLVACQLSQGRQSCSAQALWADMKELPLPEPLPFRVTGDSQASGRRVLSIDVTLADLVQFFRNPSARFLQRGWGFSPLDTYPSSESDYESYETSALEAGSLRKRIAAVQSYGGDSLPLLGSPGDGDGMMAVLRRRLGVANALPPGAGGDLEFKTLQQESWVADEEFREKYRRQEDSVPEHFDLSLVFPGLGDMPSAVTELVGLPWNDEVEFHVNLLGLFKFWHGDSAECGLMDCEQHSIVPFRHPWGSWLRHLMICANYPSATVSSVIWGDPNGDAAKERLCLMRPTKPVLERLLRVYLWGLVRPMPLFERSSWYGNPRKELLQEIQTSPDSRLLWGQFRDLQDVVEVLGDYCCGVED